MASLTSGFCQLVCNSAETPDVHPTLQVLNVKPIKSPQGPDRYRVILSDGQFFIQSMLATQLNNLVEGGELDKNVVIKLTNYVTNEVQKRKLIIILALEVGERLDSKIGDPKSAEGSTGSPAPGAAPAAAAPAAVAPSYGTASNARPVARAPARAPGKDVGPVFPIEGLSPYQNKWTIKARVTNRSEIKHWSNQRGEGKLFSVTLMDETGEIRATGFNDAVDNFYNVLEEGKVFYISRARINIAKKQFSSVNNEYEITFEKDTEITPCDDDSVPKIKYTFTHIADLSGVEKDQITDVIGVVHDVGDLGSVTSKATQKPFAKRDIQLVDQSRQQVRLTLWGKTAETFADDQAGKVIAFKGVKVGDFGGRSLSMFSSATMSVNPDIPEAYSLRGWYDAEGRSTSFNAFTHDSSSTGAITARPNEVRTIGQAKDEELGMHDKPDYFTTTATIMYIKKETFSYPACGANSGCNKKAVDMGSSWRCEQCDVSFPKPVHRYILSLNVIDHTGGFWITAFNEVAEQILGISANDLYDLKEVGDEPAFDKYIADASGNEWTLQIMAKQDTYNDQVRVRYQCRRAAPVDYAAQSAALIQQISAMAM